jgi:transposase
VHTTRPASELALELCQQLRVREVILAPISNSPDWELARRAGHARRAGEPLRNVIAINRQLAEVDELIDDRFSKHRLAPIITSMVGIGDPLGAEFLAAAGDVRTRFESADHLAGYAGLAPIPRDSHTRSGNLHRPRRYNRQLQRVFYTPAISIQHSIASRAFYDRKRPKANDTRKQ